MPEGKEKLAIAREWIAKADNDLTAARHLLQLGKKCPTDTATFHAQQCIEKYLKAALVAAATEFPKTHDIERLVGMLAPSLKLSLTSQEQAILTAYATSARYPGGEDISLSEARRAVATARRVRREVRAWLREQARRSEEGEAKSSG